MDLSAGLIVLLTFTLPAIISNYSFQYFSRIRRPLEGSPVSALSSLLISAVVVHSILVTLIDFTQSGNLGELVEYGIGKALELSTAQNNLENQVHTRYQNGPSEFLSDIIQYNLIAMCIGALFGAIVARFTAYGLWGFEIIGRLYYGGLYGAYKGIFSREIFVAVLSKDSVDGHDVIYSGILEELKLKASGQIDYITISSPFKSIAEYNRSQNNIRAGERRIIGDLADTFANAGPEVKPKELQDFGSYRLMIEGEDISNIHLESQDFRKTLELHFYELFLPEEKGGQLELISMVIAFLLLLAFTLVVLR